MASSVLVAKLPRRFTDVDFIAVSLWLAFVLVFSLMPTHNQFMLWVLTGGGVLIANHMYSVVYRGEKSQGNLYLAAITPVFLTVTSASFLLVNSLTPVTHDAFLLRWDFGISTTVRSLSANPMLMGVINLVYDALPLFMVSCIVILKDRDRKMLLAAIAIASLLCPIFYLMFPAVGPAHVGDPHAPRNCVPSMHFTWTLLLWVYSKGNWKWAFGVIALATGWATLATGEHYSLDLVAAILFTWGVVASVRYFTLWVDRE